MTFKPKDRVEHTNIDMKGTVVRDNGQSVEVLWDDGLVGILEYNRDVQCSAHRIQKLIRRHKTSSKI